MVMSLDEFTTAVAMGRGSGHGIGLALVVIVVIIVVGGIFLWRRRRRGSDE